MLDALKTPLNTTYTTLNTLLTAANLTSALDTTNLTVFVPTNAAFSNLLSVLPNGTLNCLTNTTKGKDLLRTLLSYHAAPGIYTLPATNKTIDTFVPGATLVLDGTTVKDAESSTNVTTANAVNVTAGVAHIISAVLLPPDAKALVNSTCGAGAGNGTAPPAGNGTSSPAAGTPSTPKVPSAMAPPPSAASVARVPLLFTLLATVAALVFLRF